MRIHIKKRLLEKIEKTKYCWNWKGFRRPDGYGQISEGGRQGKSLLCHRVSWEIFRRKIPKDIFVLHTCDNRKCVNPKHLYLGTQLDNMRDAKKRNRIPKGEKRWNSKLCEKDIHKIKEIRNRGFSFIKIGNIFNVSKETVRSIIMGRTWSHLQDIPSSRIFHTRAKLFLS